MSHVESLRQSPWIVWGLVMLGAAPLLMAHGFQMWAKPHYQFVVLLPLAGWLLWRQDASGLAPRQAEHRLPAVALGILLIALFGLAIASWRWSPLLGYLSVLLAAIPAVWHRGGWSLVRDHANQWIIACLAIPLPYGLDEDLIVRLRGGTTRIASRVLDFLGVLHSSYAHVIELPTKPLFIADACSGIHSLYVLIASAVVLALYCQRPWFHSLLLIAAAGWLVLVENVARLVVVASMLQRGVDLSEGWRHQALGFGLFSASLLLLLSTDRLLRFLIGSPAQADWLRFLGEKITPRPLSPRWRNAIVGTAALWPVLGLVQLVNWSSHRPYQVVRAAESDLTLPELGESALPERLGVFERRSYELIERLPGDPFGKQSQEWVYEGLGVTLKVALNSPFPALHDFCECYQNVGWHVDQQQMLDPDLVRPTQPDGAANDPAADAASVATAVLDRHLYGSAHLFFSGFDLHGRSGALLKSSGKASLSHRIVARWTGDANPGAPASKSNVAGEPPFLHVVALAQSQGVMTKEQRQSAAEAYLQAKAVLIPKTIDAARNGRPTQ